MKWSAPNLETRDGELCKEIWQELKQLPLSEYNAGLGVSLLLQTGKLLKQLSKHK